MSDPYTTASPPSSSNPLRIGDAAPEFRARSTLGDVGLSDYRGRWLVLFSHPADFTPVCTSEFVALAEAHGQFEALDCRLLGLSVDSLYSHLAWVRAIRERFGITIPFPIVEDTSMVIGRAYGMIDDTSQDTSSLRATFFIDPTGIVRAITWYPMTVGRSVDEMVRVVSALQRTEREAVMTPEGWRPGQDVLLPPAQDQKSAFAAASESDWFYKVRADAP